MKTLLSRAIRYLSQVMCFILVLGAANNSYAVEQSNPQVMLEKVAKATFQRIDAEQQKIDLDSSHLRLIIEQELMPYIDHKFAAFKVLGKQFRSVPKEQIPEFVEQFRQYLISNFAVALASYGGQELVFAPAQNLSDSSKSMTIKALIRETGRPDIHLNFKLRKNKNTQEWKTYDLVAEGISLLSSKQAEFSSLMRKEGIQAVIDMMKSKNSQSLT